MGCSSVFRYLHKEVTFLYLICFRIALKRGVTSHMVLIFPYPTQPSPGWLGGAGYVLMRIICTQSPRISSTLVDTDYKSTTDRPAP